MLLCGRGVPLCQKGGIFVILMYQSALELNCQHLCGNYPFRIGPEGEISVVLLVGVHA